jgi:uncharacterized membrane protein
MSSWYYSKGTQQNGPVPMEDLVRLIGTGTVAPTDLVWREGMTDWLPAAQVPELAPPPPAATSEAVRPPAPAPAGGQPLNPYQAPASSWVEAQPAAGEEIIPGSDPIDSMACLKRAWELTKRHFGLLIGAGLLYAVLSGGFDVATSTALGLNSEVEVESDFGLATQTSVPTGLALLQWVLSSLVDLFLGLGLARIGLNLVSGKAADISMLFGEGRKLVPMAAASIMYYAMVVVGLILLIVPGIYLALRFSQFGVAIVDKDMGAIESLKYSARLTEGNKMNLFGLYVLCILVVLAGILALLVGLLAALPVVYLAPYVAYRWMQGGRNAALG